MAEKMKNKIFNLHNEPFEFKWIFRYGFWRIMWFGIIAHLGIITVNKRPVNGTYISYGTATPLEDLWNDGYKVRLIGYVLNQPILEYRK